jgi:hypothetical protein
MKIEEFASKRKDSLDYTRSHAAYSIEESNRD